MITSGAGGQVQMVNAGKQSVSRSRNAWKTMRSSAAASETKKAARYYAETTKQVSKNLKKGYVKASFGLGSMYSAAKSVFKRVFR